MAMRTLRTAMENSDYRRLAQTKALVDYVLEEELGWDTYVGLVINLGLNKIIEDATGSSDNPILKGTMQEMHKRNAGFIATFIVDMLKAGSQEERTEKKRKLGYLK